MSYRDKAAKIRQFCEVVRGCVLSVQAGIGTYCMPAQGAANRAERLSVSRLVIKQSHEIRVSGTKNRSLALGALHAQADSDPSTGLLGPERKPAGLLFDLNRAIKDRISKNCSILRLIASRTLKFWICQGHFDKIVSRHVSLIRNTRLCLRKVGVLADEKRQPGYTELESLTSLRWQP